MPGAWCWRYGSPRASRTAPSLRGGSGWRLSGSGELLRSRPPPCYLIFFLLRSAGAGRGGRRRRRWWRGLETARLSMIWRRTPSRLCSNSIAGIHRTLTPSPAIRCAERLPLSFIVCPSTTPLRGAAPSPASSMRWRKKARSAAPPPAAPPGASGRRGHWPFPRPLPVRCPPPRDRRAASPAGRAPGPAPTPPDPPARA